MNPKLEIIRHRIEHEHDLINQRLSWLVSSQAFLLSAFAISLNAPASFTLPGYAPLNRLLVNCLPLAAIACLGVLMLTLAGAVWSLAILRRSADAVRGTDDLPVLNVAPIRWLGLAAPVFIPVVFLILWIVLLRYVP